VALSPDSWYQDIYDGVKIVVIQTRSWHAEWQNADSNPGMFGYEKRIKVNEMWLERSDTNLYSLQCNNMHAISFINSPVGMFL